MGLCVIILENYPQSVQGRENPLAPGHFGGSGISSIGEGGGGSPLFLAAAVEGVPIAVGRGISITLRAGRGGSPLPLDGPGGAAPLFPSSPWRREPLRRSEPGHSSVPAAAGAPEGRAPRRLHPRGILGGGRARLPLLPPSLSPLPGVCPGTRRQRQARALGRRAGVKGSRRGVNDAGAGTAPRVRLSPGTPRALMAGRAPQRSLPAAAAAALLLLPVSAGDGNGAGGAGPGPGPGLGSGGSGGNAPGPRGTQRGQPRALGAPCGDRAPRPPAGASPAPGHGPGTPLAPRCCSVESP